jgi:hypothetical protein
VWYAHHVISGNYRLASSRALCSKRSSTGWRRKRRRVIATANISQPDSPVCRHSSSETFEELHTPQLPPVHCCGSIARSSAHRVSKSSRRSRPRASVFGRLRFFAPPPADVPQQSVRAVSAERRQN